MSDPTSALVIRADPRLALLALAKFAALGAFLGILGGIVLIADGLEWWYLAAAPAGLAVVGAVTFGVIVGLSWWAFPGRVSYALSDGFLEARRGSRALDRIAVEQIADVVFEPMDWPDLVFSGWLSYTTEFPCLWISTQSGTDRWDRALIFPSILLVGTKQVQAARAIRRELGLPDKADGWPWPLDDA